MESSMIQCLCGEANWVEIATFCTVLIGGAFTLWQWWRSCRVSRAEHLNEILEKYDVKTMTDLFYRLVNNTSYGGGNSEVFYLGGLRFNNQLVGVSEKEIDSMLLLFSLICYEHERGTISDVEFNFFSYQIRRTLAHRQFKQYLFDFAEYCGKYKIGYPYRALAREGVKVDGPHYDNVLALVDKKPIGILTKLKEALP